MAIDDSAAQKALDRLIVILPSSTSEVSLRMASEVQSQARGNLENPVGRLADSIITTGPDLVGDFAYRTQTGPTVIYGRQRELGGPIDPVNASILTAHYRAPGYWTWDYGRGIEDAFAHHVDQEGQHYMLRGRDSAMPELLRIARRVWDAALRAAF